MLWNSSVDKFVWDKLVLCFLFYSSPPFKQLCVYPLGYGKEKVNCCWKKSKYTGGTGWGIWNFFPFPKRTILSPPLSSSSLSCCWGQSDIAGYCYLAGELWKGLCRVISICAAWKYWKRNHCYLYFSHYNFLTIKFVSMSEHRQTGWHSLEKLHCQANAHLTMPNG